MKCNYCNKEIKKGEGINYYGKRYHIRCKNLKKGNRKWKKKKSIGTGISTL